MKRFAKWLTFVLVCALCWLGAVTYLLTIGWASCDVTHHCGADSFVIGLIVLMLPVQVAIAAFLRHREKANMF